MRNIISKSLYRFKKYYLHRFIIYLSIMVAVWFISFLVIKLNGAEKESFNFLKSILGSKTSDNYNFLPLFFHNASSSIGIIILGIIPIPLYLVYIIYNASTIGFVLSAVPHPFLIFLTGILPHGIFEISAQLISVAISARIVWFVFNKLFRHGKYNENITFKQIIKDSAIDTLLQVLPLLFIAAIIETYITPILIKLVSK